MQGETIYKVSKMDKVDPFSRDMMKEHIMDERLE